MSTTKKEEAAAADDVGPGHTYLPFVVMEDLLDKLKLLHYDTEFTTQLRLKPISRHYFAIPTNPGEQFYIFSSLTAWLIQRCGIPFEMPQESDDPNTTISNILDVLRNMGISIDFPPSKLKQGCGEQAIFVLDHLADTALKRKHFTWKTLLPPEEQSEEDTVIDDAAEVTLEKIEEEMLEEDAGEDDDEDGPILDLDGLKTLSTSRLSSGNFVKPEEIMKSSIDGAEWKLEVERVLPQLKVTIQPDAKDWRNHLDQIQQYRKDMEEGLTVTKSQLDRLAANIASTLDKVNSREKYLNAQLETFLSDYRSAQESLAQAKEQYRSVSGGITDRSLTLAQITEELDQIKQEMEERGSSMTDGTPLVNIRKALTRLKAEITQMDVRIGVAVHTLLQAKLKEKGNFRVTAEAPAASYDSVY
ncbi:intraflagellar transport protein 57 homolog [Ixodes scapularis]|uniref:intraflagellar transport protein 57 homolog n=1 Tax=Ixodes scapularis TaxID=6945 RepID=UPI001A9FB797|nr:intraflagellar transport protein 57 homolog [Ixodes scapularis]